jgi:hypothetical protein
MSEENVKTVREAFEASLRGDEEKTAQLVDPEEAVCMEQWCCGSADSPAMSSAFCPGPTT